ncbi:PucR family transcriptional regulator [Actinoplanes sp. NPDC049265]|uniref:PucR family transcriptional regulator n=1 Tax=Actinoplanes sp. NPDC049265 TaxID=3363902 RepID=UPI00371ED8CB
MLADMAVDERDPTLGRVVEALGTGAVVLLNNECSHLRVGGARLWDACDVTDLSPRDVVLGVNVTPADKIIEMLDGSGVTAVAFKGDVRPVAAAAQRCGIGLLAVAEDLSWDQLYRLIQRAAATQGPSHEGDLFAYANALAALLGGAVAIEDPQGTLLAYSTLEQPIDDARRQTILGRGNPPNWSRRLEDEGYYRLLADAPGPVRVTDPEGRASARVATLVRAGPEVLGSIWVVSGAEPLGPETEQVLAQSTPQAAMHLLRLRSFSDSSRRDRGFRLRALLEGRLETNLGIDPATTVQLAAFHVAGTGGPELLTNRTRVLDAIMLACEAFRRQVFCCWIGETVYALFPDVSAATTGRLVALAGDVCARTSRTLGVRVIAGISDPRAGLAHVLECRADADRVLQAMIARPVDRWVGTVDDTRITHVLITLGELVRDRPELRLPGVRELLRQDEERGKNYLETLKAYLDASGSIPAAAAAVGVHVNTMRYRVTRVQEVSGLNLDDPAHRLVVAVELLALRL